MEITVDCKIIAKNDTSSSNELNEIQLNEDSTQSYPCFQRFDKLASFSIEKIVLM